MDKGNFVAANEFKALDTLIKFLNRNAEKFEEVGLEVNVFDVNGEALGTVSRISYRANPEYAYYPNGVDE